jgi:hypothetical protein
VDLTPSFSVPICTTFMRTESLFGMLTCLMEVFVMKKYLYMFKYFERATVEKK